MDAFNSLLTPPRALWSSISLHTRLYTNNHSWTPYFCCHWSSKGGCWYYETIVFQKSDMKCFHINKMILPKIFDHKQSPSWSESAKWPLIQDSGDGSPGLHYCQHLPPPLWQLGSNMVPTLWMLFYALELLTSASSPLHVSEYSCLFLNTHLFTVTLCFLS